MQMLLSPSPREAQVPARTWPRWLQATRFAGGWILGHQGAGWGHGTVQNPPWGLLGQSHFLALGRVTEVVLQGKGSFCPPKACIQQQKQAKKSLLGSGAVQQDCGPGARSARTGRILPLPGANGIPSGSNQDPHGACKVLWLRICLKSSAREMKAHQSLSTAPQELCSSCRDREEQGCDLRGAGDSSELVRLHPPCFGTGFVYGKKPARRRTAAPLRLDK